MRICIVSSYPPSRARLSEHTYSLLKELRKRRSIREIHIIADRTGGPRNRVREDPKVEVLRVWRPDNPLTILGIIPTILRLRPDLVHFNIHFQSFGRRRITNLIGLLLPPICSLLGLRVLVTTHNLGELVDLEKVNLKPSITNRLGILLVTKLMLRYVPRLVVTVKAYARYIKWRYDYEGVRYIPHGAPINSCGATDPKERAILMFGHMSPYKGLPVILEAFRELSRERDDVKLVVAGSSHPNFLGYLEKFRGSAGQAEVEYLGYIDEEELGRVFGSAELVVLPYLTATGTSGVFHLACGHGKPVIASDLPEIREMIAEGASALLVPPGDPQALKRAIKRLLEDPALARRMAEKNLEYAAKRSWERVAELYEEAYRELIEKL